MSSSIWTILHIFGDGGTADALLHEVGDLVAAGQDPSLARHYIKVNDSINAINNLLNGKDGVILDDNDTEIFLELGEDLVAAKQYADSAIAQFQEAAAAAAQAAQVEVSEAGAAEVGAEGEGGDVDQAEQWLEEGIDLAGKLGL